MVRDTLDPSLKVYIEDSDEVWNGHYTAAVYARQQGLALGLSDNPFEAQIRYHALSERFLVNNLNSGQQTSYASLASALGALSEVRGLPVIDEALIERGQRYEASLRVVAAIEGGLPSALKFMMFWIDWKRATDWYTWTLRP